MWSITFLIILSLSLGLGAWLLFIWSARSGQYDDMEGPKYRMLDEDEDVTERKNLSWNEKDSLPPED